MTLKQGQAILDKLAGKNQLILDTSVDDTYFKIMYGGGRKDAAFIHDSAAEDSYSIDTIIAWAESIIDEYNSFANTSDSVKKAIKTINEAIGYGGF